MTSKQDREARRVYRREQQLVADPDRAREVFAIEITRAAFAERRSIRARGSR